MGNSPAHPRKKLLAFLIVQSLYTAPLFAAGFQINEISPGLQGDATAGAAAATNDVSSMFINPATLATLQENQFYFGGSEIMPHVGVSNAFATHTVNVPGNQPPSSISAVVQGSDHQGKISPAAFVPASYLSWRLGNKLVAGLAVVAPFGLKTSYDADSVLRFAAQYSSVKTANINPALGYALNDKLSVGAGIQVQYLQAIFTNFNGPYTGVPVIDGLIAANQPTYLKGDRWGSGFNLGALYKPDSNTRLGVGFRSRIKENLYGKGQQYTSPGNVVPAPSPDFLFNAQTDVGTSVKTPDVLTISAARDLADWTVKASLQVTFWDSFKNIDINMPEAFATNSIIQTQWRNSWFGALGAEFRATPKWTVRGGLAYDETPTIGYRDPRIPDSDRIWASLGATYHITKQASLDAAYAHIFMQSQTVDVTQATGTNNVSTTPLEVNSLYARYTGSANILALALRYKF